MDSKEKDIMCSVNNCRNFGEFICDFTNEDVCGVKCRNICILKRQKELVEKYSSFKVYYETGQLKSSLLLENIVNFIGNAPKCMQQYALTDLLQHERHVLLQGGAGSGKRTAGLIQMVQAVIQEQNQLVVDSAQHPLYGVVLASSKQEAKQMEIVVKRLVKGIHSMRTGLLVKGIPNKKLVHRLKKNIQIAIGTPDVVLHVLTKWTFREFINSKSIVSCVAANVDLLLNTEFRKDVLEIVKWLPKQAILTTTTTTTLGQENIDAVNSYLKDNMLCIELDCQASVVNDAHVVQWVEDFDKKNQLVKLLQNKIQKPMAIVVRHASGAEMLKTFIVQNSKYSVTSVHENVDKDDQLARLEQISENEVDVLVLTAKYTKALSILDIMQYVVFDMPQSSQEYTAMLKGVEFEKGCKIVAFINHSDENHFSALQKQGLVLPPQVHQCQSKKRKYLDAYL